MDNNCNNSVSKPLVLVTGFGPFAKYSLNASWEGVRLMNKEELEKEHNINLELVEIPVGYQSVDERVPALWKTHTPKLTIHVGVSCIASCFTLETQAHRDGYEGADIFDKCPENFSCVVGEAPRIHTKLNVERLCEDFNSINLFDTKAEMSHDAGRYLCEYIYYMSLSVDNSRTLFVHVPEINVYPSEKTARGLERILALCLQQLQEAEDP